MASPPFTGHLEPGQIPSENVPLQQGSPTSWPYLMNRGHRACVECRRKKTKCDMRQPICGLCYRTGGSCTFPTKRKTPEQRKGSNLPGSKRRKLDPERLDRLVDLLELRLTSDPASDRIPPTASERRMSTMTLPENDDLECRIPANPMTTSTSSDQTPSGDDSFMNFSAASPGDCRYDHRSSETSQAPMRVCDVSRIADVPEALATELITIFFNKIQAWLPVFHKPKFFSLHMSNPGSTFAKQDEYSTLQMFQLYGIFALAARFSNSPFLGAIQPPDRGARFAVLAEECYNGLRGSEDELTLCYLQGCILLAFYLHASGPTHKSWLLTGVCVRLLYDLDLYNMDQEEAFAESKESWMDLEEHRRAFWLVWELDTFSAIMSRRPHAIDRQRMAVKLPVSDAAWFSNEPVESPLLDPRPSESWKVLLRSPNQDARAWFLLSNYLLAVCNDACSSRYASSQDQDDLANSVTCLTLAISQRFGLEKHPLVFNSETFADSNWIIGMHLMVLAARSSVSTLGASRAAGTLTSWREVGHLIFHWHPDYVELSHPFFICSMVPIYTQPSRQLLQLPNGGSQTHQDMLMLILSGHTAIWKLGSILLDILKILSQGTSLGEVDAQLAKYFAIYFPHANPSARGRSNANASPPTVERTSFDKSGLSNGVSRNFESREEVFEIPDTLLDYTEMGNAQMHSLANANPGNPSLTPDHVYNIDQDLQLDLDRLSDDCQPFNYLAF
ncbi:fungal-specific transcription factor domain-containing protein [Microdochium trichocladiopsis]|uniref:Fungal-specific transcription factor domain-containing protein n=1 Tax=Microdochium trichocladiopsis TaxID=1682393 RepID=A0A9P8YAJ5_9PEZI|nr:fungal-specific transcription factor domain-containing protein [Microdochium trichocladiopsis]KAH7037081.1 fungal-specific transcription factor domain-containing protein [Microdochium trichocladiopsis]